MELREKNKTIAELSLALKESRRQNEQAEANLKQLKAKVIESDKLHKLLATTCSTARCLQDELDALKAKLAIKDSEVAKLKAKLEDPSHNLLIQSKATAVKLEIKTEPE